MDLCLFDNKPILFLLPYEILFIIVELLDNISFNNFAGVSLKTRQLALKFIKNKYYSYSNILKDYLYPILDKQKIFYFTFDYPLLLNYHEFVYELFDILEEIIKRIKYVYKNLNISYYNNGCHYNLINRFIKSLRPTQYNRNINPNYNDVIITSNKKSLYRDFYVKIKKNSIIINHNFHYSKYNRHCIYKFIYIDTDEYGNYNINNLANEIVYLIKNKSNIHKLYNFSKANQKLLILLIQSKLFLDEDLNDKLFNISLFYTLPDSIMEAWK